MAEMRPELWVNTCNGHILLAAGVCFARMFPVGSPDPNTIILCLPTGLNPPARSAVIREGDAVPPYSPSQLNV